MERITIKVHLEFPGASPVSMGWPRFREFFDLLVDGLAAMPNGPAPDQVMPTAILPGSLIPVLSMPRGAESAVRTFRAGPTRRWSTESRRRAEPLYRWLRQRDATLSCGQRVMKPVVVPGDDRRWTVRELLAEEGLVHRAGGEEGKVAIRFPSGIVHCEAGPDLAAALGCHLYKRVLIEGERVRDVTTGAVLDFIIRDFRVIERKSLVDAHRELMEYLGDSTANLDVEACIREMRG